MQKYFNVRPFKSLMEHIIHLPVATRYEMIGSIFYQTHLDNSTLGEIFNLSPNTIRTAISYCNDPWLLPQRGRPHTLKPHHLQYIEARTISNRTMTNPQLAQELKSFFPDLAESKLHATTVGRARNELGLHFLPMRENCAITEHARHARVTWCQAQQEIDRNWERVVFSDESWFEIGSRKRWIWRHHYDYGDDVYQNRVAHPPKVMIWGAIGHNFKSKLMFIDGNLNGDLYYNQILCGSGMFNEANAVYGERQWIFQQDNARPHVKKDVIERIKNLGINILPWPPYSPDINVIETIWAIMKRRVDQQAPKSIEELKEIIIEVWNNLNFQTINGLIADIPRRLIQVITNEGKTI